MPLRTGAKLVGEATLGGDPAGVWLDAERRALAVYAPGGYHWLPAVGQEVLVVGSDGDGEVPCIAGARSAGGDMVPGEVLISAGTGGACIRLKNDGSLELNGRLRINGTDYIPYVPAPKGG
ncbi:MAG: hypothetical protein RRY53_00690 [Pseudoflavonifractor sp.]